MNTQLRKGVIEMCILSLISRKDMYGYEICQEFERQSGGMFIVPEGSLYPVLYRMLDKWYITDRSEKVGKRRTRVYYHIEQAGIEYLKEIRQEYFSLNRGILNILGAGDLEDLADEKQ